MNTDFLFYCVTAFVVITSSVVNGVGYVQVNKDGNTQYACGYE